MLQNYTYNNKIPNSHSGGDFLIDVWARHDISDIVTSHLGMRSPRAEYSYAEGLLSLLISQCNQNNRVENFDDIEKSQRVHRRRGTALSPDTFLYMSKQLALPKKLIKIDTQPNTNKRRSKKARYVNHEVVVIDKFNELFVETALRLRLLDCETEYVLDFDSTDLETKIRDARRYFKGNGKRAYCPVAAMINNIPVYIEIRNGNSNASFNLINSLRAALELLSKKGIKIRLLRIDSAAFTKEFVEFANAKSIKFITRARSNTVRSQIENIRNWKDARFKRDIDKVGHTTFFFGNEEIRLVIKRKSKPIVDEDGKETKDWGLATNDFESASEDIINVYALRGASEDIFRALKEFGWNMLPMRKIEFNTVYLYCIAFIYIVYRFITRLLSKIIKGMKETMRLSTFIRKFMRTRLNQMEWQNP